MYGVKRTADSEMSVFVLIARFTPERAGMRHAPLQRVLSGSPAVASADERDLAVSRAGRAPPSETARRLGDGEPGYTANVYA